MTTREAHIQFKVFLDKNAQGIAFGGAPAFLPEEIDIHLNQAKNEIISNKISGNNPIRVGFEGDFQRISELDKLIKVEKRMAAVKTAFNEFECAGIHFGDKMTITDVLLHFPSTDTTCKLMSHSVRNQYRQTYNNTPWIPQPVFILENDTLKIYVDPVMMTQFGFEPTSDTYYFDLTYIAKPIVFDYTKPDIEHELPYDVMSEVVNRAVVIALEGIESQRTQSKVQVNNLAE